MKPSNFFSRKRMIWIGGAVVVLLVAFFGFSNVVAPSLQPKPTPTLQPKAVVQVVTAEGNVVPAQRATLSFKVSGRVIEISVREGDVVRAGAMLARLDDTTLKAQVTQAEASLRAAQTQLARVQAANAAQIQIAQAQLVKSKAGATPQEIAVAEGKVQEARTALVRAQQSYDVLRWIGGPTEADVRYKRDQAQAALDAAIADLARIKAGTRPEDIAVAQANLELAQGEAGRSEIKAAQAQVDQAQAAVELAKIAAQDATLAAPFDGTVSHIAIETNQFVASGATAFLFGDLTQLQIETTDLAEVDVVKVALGQEVNVIADAFPNKIFRGTVARIASAANDRRGDKVYKVVVALPDAASSGLRWGMTVKVEIIVGR